MELVIKERGHLRLLTLAEATEATNCGQLCFLSDEIARLNISISSRNPVIVRSFCTKLFIKLRYLGLTLLGVRAHLCHLSYENPGFFDHQYLTKKLSDALVFLHRGIHQGKVLPETTTFGLVQPVVLLVQSDCRIV